MVALANVVISFIQDYSSSAVMESISKMMPKNSTVIRDSQAISIPADEIVPGDILRLETGDRVPCDCRMIAVSGIKVDQAILTGESEPVVLRTKMTSTNFLESKNMTFCGGNVVDGSGIGIVVNTGNNTMMGSLATSAGKDNKKDTYLAKEIRRAVIMIAVLCAVTAIVCFIAFVAWLRVDHAGFITWPGIVGICLGLMIAYLPEGVPLTVMLTLFIVAKRMARANVLAKDLTIIETLGSINMIASDKTGTLTQNKMSVVELVFPNNQIFTSPAGFHRASTTHPSLFTEFLQTSTHCNGYVAPLWLVCGR